MYKLLLLLVLCQTLKGAETYKLSSVLFYGVPRECEKEYAFPEENKPVSISTNANWGTPVELYRMSLRVLKDTYTTNDEVTVALLIRNESTRDRSFEVYYAEKYRMNCPVCQFELIDENGNAIPGNIPTSPFLRGTGGQLSPAMSQARFIIGFKRIYATLQPGIYRIRAKRLLPKLDGSGEVEVFSGWASFQVAAPEKDALNGNKQTGNTGDAFKTLVDNVEDHGGGSYAINATPCEVYAVKPDEVNPRGKWSAEKEGFCVSLRFRTNNFIAGQPILAYMYIRNVTTNMTLNFDLHINQGKHSLTTEFDFIDQSTNQVKTRPLVKIMSRWGSQTLKPYEEQRYLIRLDKIFYMEKGKYTIRGKVTVPKIKGDANAVLETEWNEINVLP